MHVDYEPFHAMLGVIGTIIGDEDTEPKYMRLIAATMALQCKLLLEELELQRDKPDEAGDPKRIARLNDILKRGTELANEFKTSQIN